MPTANRTLKSRVAYRVKRGRRVVFLREDFSDLGEYDQVGRALKQVVEEGLLVKIGQGLYAKSRPSTINPSRRVLAASGGFKEVSREALNRLNIPWSPSDAEEAYNRGTSTQIPANAPVIVRTRTSRKICFDTFCLDYKIRTTS